MNEIALRKYTLKILIEELEDHLSELSNLYEDDLCLAVKTDYLKTDDMLQYAKNRLAELEKADRE